MKHLAPAQQQALEQFLYGILISALLAALFAIMPYVSSDGAINWKFVGIVGGAAFLASLGHSIAVYLRAIRISNVKPADLVSVADLIDLLADGLSKRYVTQPISTPITPASPVTTSVHSVDLSSVPAHLASLSDIPLQDIASQQTAKRPAV